MMRLIQRLILAMLFIFSCHQTNAQWLKMIESSDNLYKDAKREIDLKHYQKAINMCNKAISISPRNMDIHLLLGRAYSLNGQLDSARIELNYVIQKNPKYRDAYIYLINMEAAACNYQQALEYADMGLKYFPNDRDILLKKLDVYNKEGDWMESNRMADYLFERFPTDAYVRSVYLDYKLSMARQYAHRGYIEIAMRAYEAVLEQDPMNKEALEAIFALDVRSGNYEKSLAFTNRALQSTPNSYEFLMKKISILEAMSRYVEAMEVANKMVKLYPSSSEAQKIQTYLRMEAGRYYMNTDPYLIFGGVLEKDPGNRDALNYEINIAFSRGLLIDALGWINSGLKHSPNDRDLLKKKMGVLEQLKRYGPASDIAEILYRNGPTTESKANFLELRTLAGKAFLNDFEYDSAINAFKSVLYYDHADMQAINYTISAYTQQKRYDDAIRTIDDALTYYPGDENLLYKKAGILDAYQRYGDAALISKQLVEKHPENRLYLSALIEQSMEAGRQSMQYDDYYNTLRILKEVLEKQPENPDALNYIINIESAMKQYDSALYYVDQGLHYYPESKDFLFRKSLVYADAQQYQTAYGISGSLFNDYPYNVRYRNAYVEQLLGSGRQYMAYNESDSALMEYYKALTISPNDTIPLYYTINLLNDKKMYDTALVLIDRGRRLYPSNHFFLLKRAEILESQKQYEAAWRSADTLAKMTLDPRYIDYANLLYSRRLRNEIGLLYLHSKIIDNSNILKINSLATFQFSHKYDRGVITGRINYAGRLNGTGYQFEGETYYNHSPKWYSYAVADYSPTSDIFPSLRLGYSITHSLNNGYDLELGGRYLKLQTGNVISPMASIAKDLNDFYLNLRMYYLLVKQTDTVTEITTHPTYYSAVLTSRYYLRENRTEFFTATAGYGTAPDDFSVNYNLGLLATYKTVSVGAGYQRQIYYLTTIGINTTWYNQELSQGNYKNQYDIYVTLLRRF